MDSPEEAADRVSTLKEYSCIIEVEEVRPPVRMKIPKILHQIWIGDQSKRPARLMNTWKDMHPDWEYKLWTDHTCWPELQHKIDRMPEWNGKADCMRYMILEKEGGVFADADSECTRALTDEFLDHDVFASWENEDARPGLIATVCFGSRIGSAFMRNCIEWIKTHDIEGQRAWVSVGPGLFTEIAKDYPIKIYPSCTFIPDHFTGTKGKGDGSTYAKQYWGSTFGYENIPK